MSEAHDKIQAALDQYHAAHAAVTDFEGKLKKAKTDEADALTDDSAPEAKVVSGLTS